MAGYLLNKGNGGSQYSGGQFYYLEGEMYIPVGSILRMEVRHIKRKIPYYRLTLKDGTVFCAYDPPLIELGKFRDWARDWNDKLCKLEEEEGSR
jgi:hypothetical protein